MLQCDMLVKCVIICHLIFVFDTVLSHGDHDEGDSPTHSHIQVCDDGKTGIEIDISGEKDWKCLEKSSWSANQWYMENKRCYEQERAYHVCIDKDIDSLYIAPIPHSGPHRKVWAQYGEYKYLPPGRYVHNLEHDAVVFMYHPCAPPAMVDELRQTATSCLTRHIITAFANLTEQYPFAVVTYGCVFQMSAVNPSAIKNWVRGRFGKSPEPDVYGNGQYNYGLITPAPERTSYDYGDQSSPFCPDDVSLLSMPTKENVLKPQLPATSASISYSDKDSIDSSPYTNDATRETETADMLFTEPSEIFKPTFAFSPDDRIPFKFIATINSVMKRPTLSNNLQMPSSQETVPVPISEKYYSLATIAPFENDEVDDDVTTTMGSQAMVDSQESVPVLHYDSLRTKSESPSSSSPMKTDAGQDGTYPTHFFFVIVLAVLLYCAGVAFGFFLHWCYRRNHFDNFRDSKVWRDDDGLGSFNIAAVVRKRPQLPRRGASYDKYQMLRDDFSDEDSFA